MSFKLAVLLALCMVAIGNASYDGKQTWAYSTVRNGAHMFWWLYYANKGVNYQTKPLVIWLQGGPGGSSTGFGNFGEIGPEDTNLNARKVNWVDHANILFIDNPVGTGYSYVDNLNLLTRNNTQIAEDLVQCMKLFYAKLPEFESIPLYIFSESYGGKMTTTFAIHLYKAINEGKINANFKGVALGDSWISPLDSVASWGDYLYTLSYIDAREKKGIESYASRIRDSLMKKQGVQATSLWSQCEGYVSQITGGINWYNILQKSSPFAQRSEFSQFEKLMVSSDYYSTGKTHLKRLLMNQVGVFYANSLSSIMNGEIRNRLKVIPSNVRWGGQASQVFVALEGDFMLPVVSEVDYLLNYTNLHVAVYTGQLDLIVDTLGTLNWMETLKWPAMNEFQNTKKAMIQTSKGIMGYKKIHKNLSLYMILDAGHMIPSDQPETAIAMLEEIIHPK